MKALNTLIRLHKQKIENLLRYINSLESSKQQQEDFLNDLRNKIAKEINTYEGHHLYTFMLESYLEKARTTEKNTIIQIAKIQKDIDVARDKLYEQFSELKTIEIALQKRIARQNQKLQQVETKMLDEINIISKEINTSLR